MVGSGLHIRIIKGHQPQGVSIHWTEVDWTGLAKMSEIS